MAQSKITKSRGALVRPLAHIRTAQKGNPKWEKERQREKTYTPNHESNNSPKRDYSNERLYLKRKGASE